MSVVDIWNEIEGVTESGNETEWSRGQDWKWERQWQEYGTHKNDTE